MKERVTSLPGFFGSLRSHVTSLIPSSLTVPVRGPSHSSSAASSPRHARPLHAAGSSLATRSSPLHVHPVHSPTSTPRSFLTPLTRPGRVNGPRGVQEERAGFRHFVHTALRRASAGTGPAASVSRSTARYTHLASLVPLGRVPKGRSLPRSLRSLPSLVPSSHSPLVTRHPYPPTTPRRVSGTALGHPRRGGAFSSRREPRSPVGAHLLP